MAEALWFQASGVDYSAQEDRRFISAVYTPGVINGLTIAVGTGLSVSVSPGQAVVSDGLGGAYLCYFDAASTVTVAASGTRQIWVTVNQTTGQATVGAGTAPSAPYLVIGSVVTSSTGVSSVSNSRVMADSPAAPSSKYLLSSGGTVSGTVAATTLWGQQGVRMGNTAAPTARHSGFAVRTSDQPIFVTTWQPLIFTAYTKNVTDYGVQPVNGQQLTCPVAGTYAIGGNCVIGPDNVGERAARIARYNSAGTLVFSKRMPSVASASWPAGSYIPMAFSGPMDANAGDYFQLEAWHSSTTNTLSLKVIDGTAGLCSWVSHRLIQAD